MNQQERISAMAQIMVTARQNSEDVGELLAASLHMAVRKTLGNFHALVSGRPGSWEADIVLRMAREGGYGKQEHIEALSILFALMGDAHADGGDELSQAMGKAVDTLGGLKAFAGESRWYNDLVNIGCQYSKYDYMSAFREEEKH